MKLQVFCLLLAGSCAGVLAARTERQLPQPQADVAIRNIAVFEPGIGTWRLNQDVVVRAGKITSVEATGGALPVSKFLIDGTGKFAIPGLFDNHVHMARFTEQTAGLFVAAGVTSVRDMGTAPAKISSWRQAIDRGTFMGPRIVQACGAMLEGAGEERIDHWLVKTPEAAAGIIQKLRDAGMDCVKVRTFANAETFRAIGAAAAARGMMLTGHAPEPLTTVEALGAGQRSFEHAFYPYPWSSVPAIEQQATIAALRAHGAAHVPTLMAWRPSTGSSEELRETIRKVQTETPYRLPPALLAHWTNFIAAHEAQRRGSPGWKQALATAAADIGILHRAGVLVLAGTDTGAPFVEPGWSLHDELSMLVHGAGFTPAEALASATILSARFLGRDRDLGSLTPGKIADVVILSANPLLDIANTKRIDAVVFRGETLTRAHLNQLAAQSHGGTTH